MGVGASRARGTNLVEVVVAIGILSLVMGAVFNLIPSSMLASHRGQNRLIASNLAQTLLEEKRAEPFSELAVGVVELPRETHEAVEFRATLEVTAVGAVPTDRLKQVRVTVRWQEAAGPQELRHELRLANLRR